MLTSCINQRQLTARKIYTCKNTIQEIQPGLGRIVCVPCTCDEQASVMSLTGVATAKSREKAARRRAGGAILSETFLLLFFLQWVGSSVQAGFGWH